MVDEAALPVRETTAPDPRNPYAVSKVAAELMCRQWHLTEGLDVACVRPFNHIGPLQEPRFVVAGVARQLARIVRGLQEPRLVLGNIDVSRDFSDVRDVLRAYVAVLHAGAGGGIYNVSSGREVTIRFMVEQLCEISGVHPEIVIDQGRIRPNEQRRMVASSERLRQDTGWEPVVPLRQSLEQTYESFRKDETL
jgi:GDP-4-dehydro-6-deoxy-D-mannose reductase